MTTAAGEQKIYLGNCHCGLIKLRIKTKQLETNNPCRCTCSICTKNGYLLIYPKREDVEFLAGEDKMGSYIWGNKMRAHKFCPVCATSILVDFKDSSFENERPILAVNIRIIENIEDLLPTLMFRDFDGKNELP